MKPRVTRIAAYGLITDANRMLLCRISSELPRWEGQWSLPGGGIDFAEAPVDAMVREVAEETGLIVKAGAVAHVNSIHDDSHENDFHGVRILYHAEKIGGTLRNELSGTTDKCAWFTEAEVAELPLFDIAQIGVDIIFKR